MKIFIYLMLLIFSSFNAFSQGQDLLFNSDEFVWCGLDYSKVRCIGSQGFTDPLAIKEKYFGAWNQLVLDESKKYDLKKAYGKEKQVTDLSIASERNQNVDYTKLVIDEPYTFQSGDLKQIISDYDFENHPSGLGLVYIFESLNKNEQKAYLYTIFFDLATQEIIWFRKFSADARGFGFRNYWARSIYEVISESRSIYKHSWKQYNKMQKKKRKH